MNNEQLSFFATTPKGMESLLAQELKEIGAGAIEEARSGVSFSGNLACGYKACLWSRTASRIFMVLKTTPVENADELYAGVQEICWSDHLSVKNTLAVSFSASNSQLSSNTKLRHTHFGALKVKDAIVDQMREQLGSRPHIDPINPDLRINVFLNDNQASIGIDFSGDSLHRRGYRVDGSEAPLKENLAAAILLLSGWPKNNHSDFIDPMCGSGTLPIEAALMSGHIAPGLLRANFGFMGWRGYNSALWNSLVAQAQDTAIHDQNELPRIIGYDQDARAIGIAANNAKKAGLIGRLSFERQDLSRCQPTRGQGVLIVNPPYGERLGEIQRLRPLYQELGDVLKQKFKGWEAYIFTGNKELAKSIGLKASRRFVLYNGSIECRLLKYELY